MLFNINFIFSVLYDLFFTIVILNKYIAIFRYFVNNSSRICSEDYIPTKQDIVHSRATTCGIVEEEFAFKNSFFTIIDVGGQRSERMKW